jgi:hypothetical protein
MVSAQMKPGLFPSADETWGSAHNRLERCPRSFPAREEWVPAEQHSPFSASAVTGEVHVDPSLAILMREIALTSTGVMFVVGMNSSPGHANKKAPQ